MYYAFHEIVFRISYTTQAPSCFTSPPLTTIQRLLSSEPTEKNSHAKTNHSETTPVYYSVA